MPKPQRRSFRESKSIRKTRSESLVRIPARRAAPEISLAEKVEHVLIGGDLTALAPAERLDYYKKVCRSLGLNWLTQPFSYILFRETDNASPKLQLYANKDCAAQLRKIHRISVVKLRRELRDEMCLVEADVRDGIGKTDTATGVVPLWKWKDGKKIPLAGREWANAVMKTETKAKRRATLSICGLAFLDESELDTMQILGGVTREGRIWQYPQLPEAPSQESLEAGAEVHDRGVEMAREEMQNGSQEPFRELVRRSEEKVRKGEAQPCLFYAYFPASETYQIFGSDSLKTANKDLLGPLWNGAEKAIVATAEQLGKLISQFESRGVPFKEHKAEETAATA